MKAVDVGEQNNFGIGMTVMKEDRERYGAASELILVGGSW